MTITPGDVKKWLKEIGRNRFWLAKVLRKNKRTIDDWLSSSRGIPAHAQLSIMLLMHGNESVSGRVVRRTQILNLQFTEEEMAVLKKYQALHTGKSLEELAEEFVLEFCSEFETKLKQASSPK